MTKRQTIEARALVAEYATLAAQARDAWHISNAAEHAAVIDDGGRYDADATREGIAQVRAIIAAAEMQAAVSLCLRWDDAHDAHDAHDATREDARSILEAVEAATGIKWADVQAAMAATAHLDDAQRDELTQAHYDAAADRETASYYGVELAPAAPAAPSTVTVDRAELEQLRAMVATFHAVKGIRAWAAEENAATKRDALARLDGMLAR